MALRMIARQQALLIQHHQSLLLSATQAVLFSTTLSRHAAEPGPDENGLVWKARQTLEDIHQSGTFKTERQITTPQAASVGTSACKAKG